MSLVFNIQRFSVNDGPGIRTTVFLKGCPLRCLWCHNPESQSFQPELAFSKQKCIGCGRCLTGCPEGCHTVGADGAHLIDRGRCRRSGACASACPSGALELMGRETPVEEIVAKVLRDEPFYRSSGGGMTVSGGEPMAHFPFLPRLLRAAKDSGLHVCVETSGFAPWERFEEIAGLVDQYLYDWKETDPARHRAYTGADNALIRENLLRLNRRGDSVVLRCPIIPGYNDRPDHFAGIAALAEALEHVIRVDVEPYHPLGKSKSENLGRTYALADLTFPEKETVAGWIGAIAALTAKPVQQA